MSYLRLNRKPIRDNMHALLSTQLNEFYLVIVDNQLQRLINYAKN